HGRPDAVATMPMGTKAAAHYNFQIPAGATVAIRLRLTDIDFSGVSQAAFDGFERLFTLRKDEADAFYRTIIPQNLSADAQNVMRQGFAGMLWSKQFYQYVIKDWLEGDADNPPPPEERKKGRNSQWPHLYNADVLSMPDK